MTCTNADSRNVLRKRDHGSLVNGDISQHPEHSKTTTTCALIDLPPQQLPINVQNLESSHGEVRHGATRSAQKPLHGN
ncbi:hypothetical protein RRG08_044311 [Elysia crispata]|uniref:Uncharacterized protein n=1 Tax=Elysia crispata TaxID=231223 RepID=A0AAE0XXC9_9GAST|nr:hypothetical protein RRG08_044311 [Elysia crispata]